MSDDHLTDSTTIEPGLKVSVQGKTYIAHDGDVLGREGTIAQDVLHFINTVSRRHAVISKREGFWFLTVPKSVNNSTMLDGIEVERDVPQKINGTRILKMSEACVVTLQP
ncbi:MAG: FHA domain-containing protein [Verrucomicrobiota bacterium]